MNTTSQWKRACLCAVSGDIPRHSLRVGLIVGAVLNAINQGDAILGGAAIDWIKLMLTFCVPYLVYTYGAVSSQLRHPVAQSPTGGSSCASSDNHTRTKG
jgi:hypothetical protein